MLPFWIMSVQEDRLRITCFLNNLVTFQRSLWFTWQSGQKWTVNQTICQWTQSGRSWKSVCHPSHLCNGVAMCSMLASDCKCQAQVIWRELANLSLSELCILTRNWTTQGIWNFESVVRLQEPRTDGATSLSLGFLLFLLRWVFAP